MIEKVPVFRELTDKEVLEVCQRAFTKLGLAGKRVCGHGIAIGRTEKLVRLFRLSGFEEVIVKKTFVGHISRQRQVSGLDVFTEVVDVFRSAG